MSTKILKCRGPLSVKGRLVRCILLFYSALFVLSAPLQGQQDPILRTVDKVKKNVVILTTAFPDGHEENGFGFVTGEKDGKLYLVTAGHVLHQGAKALSIQAQVFNSLSLFPAKEVRWFESDDLSLLVMDAIPGYQWEKNCLGKTPQVFDKVRFVGKEKRLVSPDEGEIFSLEKPNLIEFTIASMAPGTSGAPLVGKNGIVGMVIEDSNSSSTALALSRIRALIGNQDYPYLSASEFEGGSGSVHKPTPTVVDAQAGNKFPSSVTPQNPIPSQQFVLTYQCVFPKDPHRYFITSTNAIVVMDEVSRQIIQIGQIIPSSDPRFTYVYQVNVLQYGIDTLNRIWTQDTNTGNLFQIGHILKL